MSTVTTTAQATAASTLSAAPTRGANEALGWGTILAWSVGTIGPVTIMYLVTYTYLFFMTDHMGVSGALAGTLILAIRIYDMFADPLMGYVSDRTRSPMGRRRPWMLAGALVCVGGSIALFSVPSALIGPDTGPVVMWVLFALLVYFTGYTMFNVPYMAMPAEITDGYQDRTRLMSARVVFVAVAQTLGVAMTPWLLQSFGGERVAYSWTAWIIGGIALLAMLLCVATTGRARATAATEKPLPLLAQLTVAFSNRPFMLLIVTKLLLLTSMASITASQFYFVVHVLHRELAVQTIMGVAQTAGMLLSLPLWVRLAKRYTKHHLFMVASVGAAAVLLSWLLAKPGEPTELLALRTFLLGFFAGGSLLMGQSMLPDTMEYDYRRTGLHREGAFSGIYSMAEKASFALGQWIVGIMLSAAGYVGVKAGAAAVALSDSVIFAIYLGMAVVPALATLLCVPVLRGYTLTESVLKSMTPAAQNPSASGS